MPTKCFPSIHRKVVLAAIPPPIFSFKKVDGFVKSPSAALHCILRHCGVPISTPHSSGFARLASEAFNFAIPNLSFYEVIKVDFDNFNPLR